MNLALCNKDWIAKMFGRLVKNFDNNEEYCFLKAECFSFKKTINEEQM